MTTHSPDIEDLLDEWNNHSTPDQTSTVPALFAAQAVATPDAVAVVHNGRTLTYRELSERVAQLANTLCDRSFPAESVVAVGVPRSAEMVVCVLAAMMAGTAFVPLDPSWPAHRRRQVLADAGMSAAFVAPSDESDWGVDTLAVDLDDWRYADASTHPPAVNVMPGQLAYVIFTSGSTGKPKGAMIRHEAIAERLLWQRDHVLLFTGDDASLFKAPLSFDISVNEILLPLVSGGRVVVAEPDGEKDPEYLLELIRTQRVTFVYLVSSMLDTLLELDRVAVTSGAPSALRSLRHVWCGGEVLTPSLFSRFRRQLSTTLYHGYGPAEATIGVSHVIYRDSAERIATSIGRPNPHTQLYVLDEDMRPVPPGVGGELYAAGFLLGRGYINAPGLTASRFVANPFDGNGSRMYRTGDLARWTQDESLEFLGRADNQVKIRGRRIELEEIESQLAEHPAVRQAVVDVHRQGGGEHLVCYVVTADATPNDAATHRDIADWCRTRLPEYMVPTLFVALDRVPLTANGKIDRRSLPAPEVVDRQVSPPRTPREHVLCRAFAEALDLDEVGVDEDFFALGGDSIVAIRVVSRVRAKGYALRPRDMFAHRTVSALAPLLTEGQAETPAAAIEPVGAAAATPILRWLDEVGEAGSVLNGFYQGMALVTPADLDEDTLRAALRAVVARHHVLWASTRGGAAELVIPDHAPDVALRVCDSTTPLSRLRDDLVAMLDPDAGVMVAFGWRRASDGPGRLLVIAHHIVIDGVSLRIIAEDLADAHRMLTSGMAAELPPAPTSWRSWARQLADAAAGGAFDDDLEYWRDVCAIRETPWGDRELDSERDTVASEARLTVQLPADVADAVLTAVPDRIHGHVNDAMVAALYLALRVWRADRGADAPTLLVEIEGHGREGDGVGGTDLSATVGWFTTLYPVALHDREFNWRAALSGGQALGAAVRSIKDQLRAVPSHGLSYGALRYLRAQDDSLVAQPQVLFNYLGRFDTSERPWAFADDGTGEVAVLEDRDQGMPLPRLIEINAEAVNTGTGTVLRATFSWPSSAISEADVAAIARRWTELLTSIAGSTAVSGHSVCDFPRVRLTADDVAELESRYPGLSDVVPLTPTQQGIYFHSTFSRGHDPYVVQQIVDITGPLDVDRFQRATETVVARHHALSAAFTTLADGTPVAVHATPVAPDFDVVDDDRDDPAVVVAQRAAWERNRRFNLAAQPLTRYTLVRHHPDRHTLIQTVHHIVADGWSVPIVLDDLLTAYAGSDFDGPAPQFAQFVDWLGVRDDSADRAAWARVLDGIAEPTRIAAADGTSAVAQGRGFGSRTATLPSRAAVAAAASTASVTVGTLLHTAWGLTLGRLTGSDDVVFGTVVSGRGGDVDGIETMVGLLVNTVPVRVTWSPNDNAVAVAGALARVESDLVEHHHLPLQDAHRIAGVAELFDSLVVIENLGAATHAQGDLRLGDISVVEAPHYAVTVMIAVKDTVTVTVTNDRAQVSDAFADVVAHAFTDVVNALIADPAAPIGTIALAGATPPPPGAGTSTVTHLIADAIAAHRDDAALVTGDSALTFGDIDSRASVLARRLVDAGVRRGDIVALATSRSADLVPAIWAIICAGAAYLPVDLSYPRARIEFMLDHARPRAALVDDAGRAVLAGAIPDETTMVSAETVGDAEFEPVAVGPLDAVSVLYTSGSTGEPKAVVGTHGALANRLAWAVADWPAQTRLAKSSLSFIDGTTELLAGLAAGACTVLADDEAARDGTALAKIIASHRVEQVLAVPSLAAALADEHTDAVAALQRWIVSGEALERTHLAALRAASPSAAIVNSYGSSEVAGDVLAGQQHDGPDDIVTLGTAVPGAGIRILDRTLNDVPDGVIGEIYVSGVQLARGYLRRPAQTATRFVATGDGDRMFRTGDLGARLPDGRVVFAGRADSQLKINGNRVEPGEVEAALRRRPGVSDAAVFGTGCALAAAVVLEPDAPAPDTVLADLADELPRHLLPTSIRAVDAIPLLPNGKRDNTALIELVKHADDKPRPAVAPADDVQRAVVEVVAAVLGRDTVSADADFFALGGDSVGAIRVTSRLARKGYHLTTEDVFRNRTPVALAALITAAAPRPADADQSARPLVPFSTVRLSEATIDRIRSTAAVEDIWAMSPLQQGVYYQTALDAGSAPATYIAQNTFDFARRIDVDAMAQAFTALLRRHPQLRVGFHTVEHAEPEPVADATALVQVVVADPPSDITVIDLTGQQDPSQAARLAQRTADADRATPFDVTSPPLLRLTVLRMPGGRDRILFTYHFLLFDGWSRELVLRELFALYDARGAQGAVEPHGDLVVAHLEWLARVGEVEAADAWRELLAGVDGPTLASGVEPGHPDADPGSEPGRIVVKVPAHTTERLLAQANDLGTTLNAVVTTAVSAVTGFHAGRSDVVIGATVAGRPGELVGIDETIGLFLNTVPVRVDLSPTRSLSDAIRAVGEQRVAMMRHDHLGLGQIQRAAGDSGLALFDSLLVLQNFLDDDTFTDLEAAHGIVGVDYHDTTHFPLTWVLTPGRELTVKLEHRVIGDARAREMVDQLLAVLDALAERPDRAVGSVDLIPPRRREELEDRWRATERPLEPVTIAELLARRAASTPDAVALVFGDRTLTYREFDDRVSQLARYLRRHGAEPETFVALAMPRSIEMVVALFAVLRAGAAYLPLELDLPIERLRTIVDDARPVLLLTTTDRTELSTFAEERGATVVSVDDAATAAALADVSTDPLTAEELGEFAAGAERLAHPAYLIYTSGSTGRPKGVLTGYAGLTNMYFNHREAIFEPTVRRVRRAGRDGQLNVAHTVSFSFDMSWEELFWLVEGHRVHICDEDLRRDALALVAYCHRHLIDVINVTPTYAHHLLDAGLLGGDAGQHPPALVLLGGEAVGDRVWSVLRAHPACAGYNLYGPTEYTINTLGGGTDDSSTPTVGRPIWNTRGYIFDAALRPVPDGAVGELYIAGVGLARGYHRRAGTTAATMVADPYRPGQRMYRTGDLVRRRPDGHLDFLGRADDQVKIRGYRVELGEIESVLAAADGVARCAVVVRSSQPNPEAPAVKSLTAYVVPTTEPAETSDFVAGLRDHLAAALPDYMVPTRYGVVADLPLTINGKLDVAALPEPLAVTGGASRAPRTEREARLLEVVSAVLGVDGIGVDDDFFALGGDSISSITVCGRARKAGLILTPREVFRRRTIAAMAAAAETDSRPTVHEPDTGVGAITPTPMLAETVQARTPLSNFYQSMVLSTPAGITLDQLERVLEALLATHAMLRARLDMGDEGWSLTVPQSRVPTSALVSRREGALSASDVVTATAAAAAELAPEHGVMVRAHWYDTPGAPGQLLLVIHHVVIDGVSWRIIGEDLARAWQDIAGGRPVELDEVPTSFRTWSNAIATARFDAEVPYWTEVLSTPDPDLGRRPLDPAVDVAETVRTHRVSLHPDVSSALLSSVPAAIHGGVNDVLLTAFSLALAKWRANRGQDQGTAAVVNVEGHGREPDVAPGDLDLSRTVGWFTAIYPVRVDPGPVPWIDVLAAGRRLATAAKAVKEQLRAVPNRGLGYGVLRYVDQSAPSLGPAPQILFNYLGRFAGGNGRDWQPVPGIGALREGVDPANPAVALEINAIAEDGPDGTELAITLGWPGGLLDADDIADLAALWIAALTALTRCDALTGHTPSDFPLVSVTQDDIDEWEQTAPVDDVLPLLPLQQGMYFHNAYGRELDGYQDTYRIQQIAELVGPLNPDGLRDSVAAVIHRHQALRAGFRELADGTLAQVIWSDVPVEFDHIDGDETQVGTVAAEALSRPFDLARPPLVRYTLVSLSATEHRLIQTMHHIIADGWSYPVIFGDVVANYNSRIGVGPKPAPVAVSLRDHIETVAAADHAAARDAWSAALVGVEATTLVPTNRHTVGEHRSTVRRLSPDLTHAVTAAARDRGITVSTALHGAWGVLLGRLLDRRQVVFGSTVSGRGGTLEGTDSIVGLLINTIPVPMSWEPDTTIAAALVDLQERQSALLDAQHIGLTELSRMTGIRELFDTIVVVENFPKLPSSGRNNTSALEFRGFSGTDSPHYPVSLVAYLDNSLTVEIKYDAAVVTEPQAQRYAEHVERILAAFAEVPDTPVGRIDLRTEAERALSASTTSRRGPDRTLADAFGAAAERWPDAVAVSCGDKRLTYAELDARAAAVAATLIDRGVRPESRVAVAVPRSANLIVALLAVIKAGGTYVPLDIDSPAQRLRHIVADSEPVCVLTDRPDRLDDAGIPVVVLTDAARRKPATPLPATGLTADHAAYIIYTSGSTGVPKGVAVSHRNVGALFQAAAEVYDFGPDDVWTMFHSAAFDFSVWELWGPLLHGGRLVVVEQHAILDPDLFIDLLATERVTVLNQTPSAFYPLIEADRRARRELALRYVIFGGEALDVRRLADWFDRHRSSPRLVNMYGITETCVHVSHRPIYAAETRSAASVIGGAIPGLRIHLLDSSLQPVPIGVVGELYISGGQLARGYVSRPGLTASRFVANPFDGAGERLYRSGDTAMWTEDGDLVYVGRSDQQVKLRGFRIELGEVEAALAALPQVSNAAAAVRSDDHGRSRLIGYVVANPTFDVGQARARLAERLPDYMVPAAFVEVDALPLTTNGKLDRAALPSPPQAGATVSGPTTQSRDTASLLAALCSEILAADVGVDDDFFTVGGDSIVAIQLVNRARRHGVRITPQQVFVHRTPAALAEACEGTAAAADDDAGPDLGEVMLTPIVHRLAELGGTVDRFNQAELLRTPVGVTVNQLEAAVNAVIARHDALRLRLHRHAPALWSLETTAAAPVSILRVDAHGLDDDQLRETIAAESDAAADRLNPAEGTVVAAVWFDLGPDRQGRLLLVVHHLAVDGVSWRILIDDLAEACRAVQAGHHPTLPPVPTSIRTYARAVSENAQQAARLAEFEHWASVLAPGGELDPGANVVTLTVGQTRDHEVRLTPAETVPLLTTVPAAANADVTETLVAALYLAIRRWRVACGAAADAPLVLDLERHGRDGWGDAFDLSRTVGWFTSIAPVRLPATDVEDPIAVLKEVKERLRAAPDGGLGFGQLRYCNPRTAAALGRLPNPQLLFNYLGRWVADGADDWDSAPEVKALRTGPNPDLATPYLLEVNAICDETANGPVLRATLTYADGDLSAEDVSDLGDHWADALREFGGAVADTESPRAGALTPSDVDLVHLSQAQIDHITAVAEVPIEAIWPLSPLQEGVYFQARYATAAVYIVQNVFDFAEPIDAAALRSAYSAVMRRNPVLRSIFLADDLPQPVAAIVADPVWEPEIVDLTGLATETVAQRIEQITSADRLRTFALDAAPLARITVIRTGVHDRLIFSYHFLLLDGWSREQLLREVFAAYAAARRGCTEVPLPQPVADFTDYLRWLQTRDRDASTKAWANALANLAGPTLLVPDAVGTAPTLALRLEFTLTAEESSALTACARRSGLTLNAMISTALAMVLAYETGSADVVFGSTVAGRPTDVDGIDSVIGLFLNTVPTRVRLDPDRTLADTMRTVQSDRLGLMDHEYIGLGDIARAAAAANGDNAALSGGGPLFDSLYVLQNFLDDDTFTDMESEHGIVGHDSIDASHYPLTWVASPGRRLWVKLEYRPDVVERGYAQRLLDRLRQLLLFIGETETANAPLAGVPLALPDERRARDALAEATSHGIPDATVMDLLAERTAESAAVTAMVCGDQRIDYLELQSRVNRLAWLLRQRGIGPENTVALAIPRSIDTVVALFAVLRAGAAYLPLELDYPDERLAVMLDDARPVCVLATTDTADRIAGVMTADCPVIALDYAEVAASLATMSPEWDGYSPGLDDPAYVIYTSGSTGRPKGVITPHRGLTNMHLNHRESIFAPAIAKAGGRRLRIAHTVSFSFDMSWEELLWLIEGHEVHICDEQLRRDATALVAYCHEHRIDVINVTPTYAALLFDEGLLDPRRHPPVLVLLGGEAVSATVWSRLRDGQGWYGYNLYGPTEYTINTLGGGTDDSATPTVGRPIWNTRAHILDAWLRPVPAGVAGELYIAGAGLARGYLGQPALTASRFVANPFEPGRMYRTGDLVLRRLDGNIEFLGRTDDQVKIRGYRVELGDIQAAMAAHDGVAQAAVIARPDPDTPGSHRLVGYVVPSPGRSAEVLAEVRAHLKATLPTYMIPTAMATLDTLPLTDNGKLNVRALPDVAPSGRAHPSRAPQSAVERTLCGLFGEVLGVDDVGVDDDFFDLGGHSLSTIRLISRVRATLEVELSLGDVFNARTVEALARRVESVEPTPASRPQLVAAQRPDRIPASPAQERLLILERIGDTGSAYNYPLVFRVTGAFDVDAFEQALTDVVDRHESLRTVFGEDDQGFFQRILPPTTRPPVSVTAVPEAQRSRAVGAAVTARFDLSTQIPLRVTVFRTAPDDHTVVILLHHIATDEWSDTPLLSDLDTAYRSRVAGEDVALPALPVQYADYALWQGELLAAVGDAQLQFWRDTLAEAPDEMTLPTDRPRPPKPSGAGGTLHVELPPKTAAALHDLATSRQVSALMLLHAAVAVLLHRVGAGDDVVVGTPVAGRDEAALSELVGFFVNTLVLRVDLAGNPSFDELLARVRTADLAAFAHQDLPFDRLVEALNPPRVAGRNPLFNVFVGYHLRDDGDDTMFGLPTEWSEPPVTAAMFDLGFTLIDEKGAGLSTVMAEFNSDLFDEHTVRTLALRLVTLLDRVAADPTAPIGAVDVLFGGERDELLSARNDTSVDLEPISLADLVSRQAASTPDAVAVVFDSTEVTYAELDGWSNRLAARLVAGGAGACGIVGVSLPRSVELIVALVAVVKSGAAFLALDPDYPSERLAYMVDDAQPAVVLDDLAQVRAARDDEAAASLPDIDPAGWAYVLYTSGSTGRPKGVAVPHAGIVNRIAWLQHAYPLSGADRMLVKTPISFDTSVWEVFWPLSVGATLVLARPGGHRDPAYIVETIAAHNVTAVDFVPSMLELFLDEPRSAQATSLTRVTVGGEALPTDLARRFAATLPVPLHNLYGPTEASVDVLGWTADGGPVALGLPGWNVEAYVLDNYLNPVPQGAPGELYLAGVQLADGYLHRSAMTAHSFVANPFGDGTRMYRTGDIVRWRTDNQLEYLGRVDDQIKLRGVRIEPAEIETVLGSHPAVASARVVVRSDRLIAYYVADGPTDASTAESLRAHAAAALPLHMVPSAFVELAAYPLSPSGKLDRKALPDPQIEYTGRAPTTDLHRHLCGLFTEILGTEVASIDADFFALGGHSLLLVRLAAAIRREFDVDLAVGDLMLAPTVADIAERLTCAGDGSADSLAQVLPLRPTGWAPPLFCLPPASGLSWQFAGLKRYLPQHIPIYGLQSPLFTTGELPDSLAELAAAYADLVVELAPSGPIRLLGWSFGGSLALLMAQELTSRGRAVTFVGMLDTRNDARFQADTDLASDMLLVGLLREMGYPVDPDATVSIAEAVELVRDSGDAIAILDEARIGQVIENYVAAERLTARADYGRYEGDVFFVDATVPEMDFTDVASDGWHDHIGGTLRVVPLPCRHSELMDAETLEQLGPLIAAELL
ncbi:non-ribosomal peptide synthetase [Mycolicibacterium agri]|uniref:Non-ribosomal peptide synthetase n=1 Tax=Mycolicibacterium agri TaxID=36811 RepID=A0A2A7NDG9_MYCAG|nr:non-ribosomal peptide synthetase [Mycolicibacterium agri]PEG42085.1 non-ribosomal peptide synthetase [Mycolicibacterium agri]GFG49808.1 non-ribosomal peptide synthetase [Mycolicibacterium agri]